jgi:predicted alpha/beta-hydrolase family hydrolase
MPAAAPIEDLRANPPVRGFIHEPDMPRGAGLVLAHGAGSNSRAPMLAAVAEAFSASGFLVLRCDLPFRQARPHGPPLPAMAARDREGLQRAAEVLRERGSARVFLGGHSYGGRQATILAASKPDLAAGLLLLSYPLHPPNRPADKRTAHFPQLTTPALFIQGTRDPFGSLGEMRAALDLVAGPRQLLPVEGAGHDLGGAKNAARLAAIALDAFLRFANLD